MPGKIVFKNDLMEPIEYVPHSGQVRAVPLLASPPWINKYCVMDPARFGHQAPRLVAGGPDDVARSRGRRTRKAASHGQRPAPGHRGCPGQYVPG
jgi:hypothetical protein